MKQFKSTVADRLFFPDGPPAYEHEVIANLEDIADARGDLVASFEANFSGMSEALGQQAEQVASVVGDGFEGLQSQIDDMNDEISDGLWEANYTLLDIAKGVGGIRGSVEHSRQQIVQAIHDTSSVLSAQMDQTNHILQSQFTLVNTSLQNISGNLSELIKLVASPNKTEALELADQARQNIALEKKDRALHATDEAMELSSGTSITVLAYHILTLSLFEDRVDALLGAYEDYANLVAFKLTDPRSEKAIIVQELETTLYSVMAVMGSYYHRRVKKATIALYAALEQAGSLTERVLGLPLVSRPIRKLISQKNFLREIHWSLLLTRYVIPKNERNIYLEYFRYLSQSGTLVETELTIMALKYFEASTGLYQTMASCLLESCNSQTLEALNIIYAVLPQDVIPLDNTTLRLMQELAQKQSINITIAFQGQLDTVESMLHQDLDVYRNTWDKYQAQLHTREAEALQVLEQTAADMRQKRDVFEQEENVASLRRKIEENKKTISTKGKIINAIVSKDDTPIYWPYLMAIMLLAALGYGTGVIQDQPFVQEYVQWFKDLKRGY